MNQRISQRQHFIYHHQTLLGELNQMCMTLKMGCIEKVGVPTYPSRLIKLQERINEALEDRKYADIRASSDRTLNLLITACKDIKPMPLDIEPIDTWWRKVTLALEEFKSPLGPKY